MRCRRGTGCHCQSDTEIDSLQTRGSTMSRKSMYPCHRMAYWHSRQTPDQARHILDLTLLGKPERTNQKHLCSSFRSSKCRGGPRLPVYSRRKECWHSSSCQSDMTRPFRPDRLGSTSNSRPESRLRSKTNRCILQWRNSCGPMDIPRRLGREVNSSLHPRLSHSKT